MLTLLTLKLPEVVRAIAPLVAVVCVLQIVLVQAPAEIFLQFLAGSALAIVGMLLLFVGIDLGILPMGRYIGAELPRKGSLALIASVAFALGFATTVAEPDVLVLAGQVEAMSEGALSGEQLTLVIGGGVGLFTAFALLRVVWGWSMPAVLTATYLVMIALSLVSPVTLLPLAYDAGSVTTGVLTAPVVLALAIGVTTVLAGRSAVDDGFGLLGLASMGAIIAVLIFGLLQP